MTGSFCWTELAVDDLERAVEFYGRVFPWKEAVPVPSAILGSYFEYSMLSTPDGEIGGAYELLNEQRTAGVLPHWLAFISVESTDRIAERARRNRIDPRGGEIERLGTRTPWWGSTRGWPWPRATGRAPAYYDHDYDTS